ncbi:MAG: methylmalonyl-CoA mutase family protein [Planctomycetota bacterium]
MSDLTWSDLAWVGPDGIPIEPLYTEPVDIDVPAREGAWQIRPRVHDAAQAAAEIAGGADSLWYVGPDTLAVPGCPVVDASTRVATFDELLTCADDVEELRVTLGRDVFHAMAKVRAARVLWFERTGRTPFVHAVGDYATLTRYDPWTNIMRQTTQAFAAAVGGADAITVWGYDAAGDAPSDLGRRIARNTQLVLRDEAQLHAFTDAARGSYYLDWLTKEIVERARRGPSKRAAGDEPIVGVTHFPLAGETPLGPGEPTDASPYESLRDAPAAPIYLCKLGTPKEHGKTAAFARNLFVTGGFTVVEGDGPDGFAASGASIACVVGPGDVEIPGAARVVRELDPKMDRLAFLRELRA